MVAKDESESCKVVAKSLNWPKLELAKQLLKTKINKSSEV